MTLARLYCMEGDRWILPVLAGVLVLVFEILVFLLTLLPFPGGLDPWPIVRAAARALELGWLESGAAWLTPV